MKSLMNDITLESVLQVEGIVAKRPEDQVRKVSKSTFFFFSIERQEKFSSPFPESRVFTHPSFLINAFTIKSTLGMLEPKKYHYIQ